jgi:two-component system sensor histidine kinase DesK
MKANSMTTATDKPEQPKRAFAYVWFAYTGFIFIQPIMEPSRNMWLGTLAVFAIFLGIFASYVRINDERGQRATWAIVATFLLGLLSFPWNPGCSTFFVYTAAFIPFSVRSTTRVLLLIFGECLCIIGLHFLFPHRGPFEVSWPNAIFAIFLTLVIGGGNIFFAQQKRADCRLRQAQEENFALATLAERERIARDLHDVLGHTLSVIVLKAELAGRLLHRDPTRAAQEIAEVESTARSALAEVREAIGGYRSQGFAAELQLARNTLDAAGVVLHYESPSDATSVPLAAYEETVLSLAVREAVTNIVRHAQATRCTMRLSTTPDGYRALLVEDDGKHRITREGNGLRGMRERVLGLGGRLSIRSEQGTALLVEIPLASSHPISPPGSPA